MVVPSDGAQLRHRTSYGENGWLPLGQVLFFSLSIDPGSSTKDFNLMAVICESNTMFSKISPFKWLSFRASYLGAFSTMIQPFFEHTGPFFAAPFRRALLERAAVSGSAPVAAYLIHWTATTKHVTHGDLVGGVERGF